MTAYLVRHAKAGDRADWEGDDRLRPLSKPGWRQAEGLVEVLKDTTLQAVLSSPYLRCVQTVEPLARHFGLRVQHERSLAEGAGAERLEELIRRSSGRKVAMCTHGDVLEEFLEHLIAQGLVARARAKLDKGSIWAIEHHDGRLVNATYIPAP